MIDGYHIMTTLQSILESDATLKGILGSIEGNSKVLLGSVPPESSMCPIVMIPDSTYTPERTKRSDFVQDITIWTILLDIGTEDFDLIYSIARQIDVLLDSKRIECDISILAGLRLAASEPTNAVSEDNINIAVKALTYQGWVSEK
jgi:hypothetical protein